MKYLKWIDQAGVHWREMISESYEALKDRKEILETKGYRCWLSPYDINQYVLTVREHEPKVSAA